MHFLLRVRNLPPNVRDSDIEDYFDDVYILEGGIKIIGDEAFIAVANTVEAVKAMSLNGTIKGYKVKVVPASILDVKLQQLKTAKRKLNFDDPKINYFLGKLAASQTSTHIIRSNNMSQSQANDLLEDNNFKELNETENKNNPMLTENYQRTPVSEKKLDSPKKPRG